MVYYITGLGRNMAKFINGRHWVNTKGTPSAKYKRELKFIRRKKNSMTRCLPNGKKWVVY
jgi:hypothetical protein